MRNDNGRLNFATGLDNSQLRSGAAEARTILQSISGTAVQESDKMSSAFNKLGTAVVGAFTIRQAGEFVKKIVTVRGEIEALEKSYATLAGKQRGAKLFEEIKDYAIHTPMMLGDLAKGGQTLMAFNISAEKVMPTLRTIGDIAMGDSQKFHSLILAFSQMSSTGRLMGQDLLQMVNAGFNPLTIISQQTGKSMVALKKEMEEGAISAEMVQQAFTAAAAEGGKFYGMLESQSKGVKGVISNFKGALEEMFNEIGKNSQGVIVNSVLAAQKLIENYETIGRVIAELVGVVGVYKAALITLNATKTLSTQINAGWTASELLHYNALVVVEKAQKLLNATILKNPYVLAAAAVAALAYGLYKYFDVVDQTKKATEDHSAALEELNGKYQDEENHINSLIDAIKGETTARVVRTQALNELKNLYPEIFDKYIDEKGHIRDLIGLQKELNNAQAEKKMTEQDDLLSEYKTKLRDYKQLQHATEKGWSWASAGTTNNVNTLTEDWGFFQSKASFLKEKISYWQQMVNKQQGVVDENNYTRFMTALGEKSDEDLTKLKAMYDADEELTEDEIRRLEAINAEIAARSKNTVVENKAYWEGYKKEQQALLDAMTESELATSEAATIRANIAKAQEKLDAYNVVKGNRSTEQANSEQAKAADRVERIKEYERTVSREVRQAELEIRQAEVDAMQEGYKKSNAQIQLTYDRMVEENINRKEAMVEALRDKEELAWKNANPNAAKEGKTFDRSSVTSADLSKEQLNVLSEYKSVADNYRANAEKKLLSDLIEEYVGYEDSRLKIAQEYAEKRALLYEDGGKSLSQDAAKGKTLKESVNQATADELNYKEDAALQAIDEQFASRQDTYEAWCENLTNLTLERLEAVLKQAEEELDKVESSGEGGQKLATARAKVATVREKVSKKKAQKDTAPSKRSIKEWNDLRKALEDCCSAFDDIGDAVGGVAGEIISVTGNILSSTLSMVNGIVQLVQMSAAGMQGTATAAATAISTIEKASVILAVISAAMQVAMAIVNLFNNDEEKQKQIEALQSRIDELQWELDNANIMELRKNSINSLEMVRKKTEEVTRSLFRQRMELHDVAGAWKIAFAGIINDAEGLQKTVDELSKAYANVAYTADKALGGKKYEQAQDDLKKIAEQQLLIQQQIAEEDSKKKTDHGKIEEWERQIEELGAKAIAIMNEMVEDIIGGTSNDIANELADAFFEAFEAGEDAAEAWGDKVNEIVGDILKRLLVQKFLEEPLGEIFNKYKEKWFKDGEFVGIDAVIESMSGFAADLNAVGSDFQEIWDALPEEIKNLIGGGEAIREASEKGIATASQESVDELNGRMTAVQGHTYSIAENTRTLTMTSGAILQSVLNIESNTDSMDDRMARIEGDMKQVKDTVNDFALKGIKIQ